MYTFSSKLKTFSFILMILGILGIGYGFLTAPKNIEDVEKILAAAGHDDHAVTVTSHGDKEAQHQEAADISSKTIAVKEDSIVNATEVVGVSHENHVAADTAKDKVVSAVVGDKATSAIEIHEDHEAHTKHLEHVLHQLQNKPWAALYVAAIFFMLISLGVLAFYAIQYCAQAGWSPVLFRVMEGITSYLLPGSIIFFLLLVASGLHFNHLFVWMDKDVVAGDPLIQAKTGYLNVPFFLIRAAIFLIGWNLYRYFSRKNSLAQEESKDNSFYKKNFKISAAFLVFFIVTESIMSWDWIMSVDPHWYSTLFGWYVFASFFVSGITVIAMITLYLKSKGLLEYVNSSHLHDLAKFMFGISIFWTYLWFSQFMLIWYANIPEEITYFVTRIEQYNLPFFGMVAMNFLFPLLILINTDFKRIPWILIMAGVVILCGHYLDFFNMIMPATVGDQWFIGVSEISSVLFFLGLFIFVVFTALAKTPLLAKKNPLIEESKHFHY